VGGSVVKNWSPRDIIRFLKKNGFVELKKHIGDHCCLFNSETKAYTEVDKGRDAFTAREMLGFIQATQIPKEHWKKGKRLSK